MDRRDFLKSMALIFAAPKILSELPENLEALEPVVVATAPPIRYDPLDNICASSCFTSSSIPKDHPALVKMEDIKFKVEADRTACRYNVVGTIVKDGRERGCRVVVPNHAWHANTETALTNAKAEIRWKLSC